VNNDPKSARRSSIPPKYQPSTEDGLWRQSGSMLAITLDSRISNQDRAFGVKKAVRESIEKTFGDESDFIFNKELPS